MLNINQQLEKGSALVDIWRVILVLSNVAVLIILIAVGFGTIFHIQIDTYGIKKAIMPLIIGIILANFSLIICRTFLDISNVVTVGILNQTLKMKQGDMAQKQTDNFRKLGVMLGEVVMPGVTSFDDDYKQVDETKVDEETGETTSDPTKGTSPIWKIVAALGIIYVASGSIIILGIILFFIMALIPSIIMFLLGFLFYARVIMLFILIVISPLAFLCISWSPAQGLFKKWWDQFIKWAFMVPVAFFFFWMAILVHNAFDGEFTLWGYITGIIMMVLAATAPFKMGGAIGGMINGVAKKYGGQALGWGKGAAWTGINRGMEKRGLQSFRTMKAGFQQGQKKLDEELMVPKSARSQAWSERYWTRASARINPVGFNMGKEGINKFYWKGMKSLGPRRGFSMTGEAMRGGRIGELVKEGANIGGVFTTPAQIKKAFSGDIGRDDAVRALADYYSRGGSADALATGGVDVPGKLKQLGYDDSEITNIQNRLDKASGSITGITTNQEADEFLRRRGGVGGMLSNDRDNQSALINAKTQKEKLDKMIKLLTEIAGGSHLDGMDAEKQESIKTMAVGEAGYLEAAKKDEREQVLKSGALGELLRAGRLSGDNAAIARETGLSQGHQAIFERINPANIEAVEEDAADSGHLIIKQLGELFSHRTSGDGGQSNLKAALDTLRTSPGNDIQINVTPHDNPFGIKDIPELKDSPKFAQAMSALLSNDGGAIAELKGALVGIPSEEARGEIISRMDIYLKGDLRKNFASNLSELRGIADPSVRAAIESGISGRLFNKQGDFKKLATNDAKLQTEIKQLLSQSGISGLDEESLKRIVGGLRKRITSYNFAEGGLTSIRAVGETASSI